MTITNQYITTFLSSYKIFKELNNDFNYKNIKPYLFIETRNSSNNKTIPDYVYKEVETTLFNNTSLSFLINNFFERISSILFIKNKKIYVKEDNFQEWQEIITRISPLMIIAYFLYKNENIDLLDDLEYSLLPSIYNKRLEYIMQKYIINDLHIHLNGTTEFDTVWQDILKSPTKILPNYEKGFNNPSVKEEYFELGIFDIVKFIRDIRDISKYRLNGVESNYSIKCEIKFFMESFKNILDENYSICKIEKFYKYILMYNTNYKLLVQQINQIGFDSFEKITNIEIREQTEKDYKNRFQQVKTLYNYDNIKLEGRFAPKKDMSKLVKLIDSIRGAKKEELSLVGHFIKKKDKFNNEIFFYRHKKLRRELKIVCENVLRLVSKKEYSNIINGFDAAANELYARPEVFAPTFKKLKSKGYDQFTFHGGEDFIDLVSGIRYVYEIVEFLDFENGDRIGHATALGIDPKLWQQRVGKSLFISQGEYLDNLIFAYILFSSNSKKSKVIMKIVNKINKLCKAIYGEVHSLEDLINAWELRKNDPESFFTNLKESFKSKELFKAYHSDGEIIIKYNKKISFDTNFFSPKELKIMQNITIEKLNSKNIVIESMITSNKMISFYKNYDEHHISRWLLKSPKPIVLIATDDPGIFATNIKNELVHLYLILKKKMDNEEEVFEIIKKVILNANIYKFSN
jgi:adenosine deaminase